jgi:FkbM family methyltransferase
VVIGRVTAPFSTVVAAGIRCALFRSRPPIGGVMSRSRSPGRKSIAGPLLDPPPRSHRQRSADGGWLALTGDGSVRLMKLTQRLALSVHRVIARSRITAWPYLIMLGAVSRLLNGRLYATACNVEWPAMRLPARRVDVGGVSMLIHPHAGEFDFEALFCRTLHYEAEMFAWLRSNAANYKQVVEIGANVGIYTCYMAALNRARGGAQVIYAFEPSREAFLRLQRNLAANGFGEVQSFNVAVADEAGFLRFFEAPGHLTNGSFLKEVADFFQRDTQTSFVACVGAREIASLLADAGDKCTLFKIDVEGYEPPLIAALSELMLKLRADVLFEVLGANAEEMQPFKIVQEMELYHLTDAGPVREKQLHYSLGHRDWLLKAR